MRVPYADPSEFTDENDKAIAERIQKRRENEGGLLELDKALLNAPPLADGWNSFFGAIRTGTTISASLRETIMCRVAVLNHAWYEWEQHAPILRRPVKQGGGGMGISGLQYIWHAEPFSHDDEEERDRVVMMCLGNMSTGSETTQKRKLLDKDLTAQHYAVLQMTDQLTLQTRATDEVFDEVKKHFDAREITELAMTIAGYNCCSRFLTCMDVGERNGKEGALKALQAEGAGLADENLPAESMTAAEPFSLEPANMWSMSDIENMAYDDEDDEGDEAGDDDMAAAFNSSHTGTLFAPNENGDMEVTRDGEVIGIKVKGKSEIEWFDDESSDGSGDAGDGQASKGKGKQKATAKNHGKATNKKRKRG